ncbi:toll-Interleukin receptor [Pseudomonadota bacterium]
MALFTESSIRQRAQDEMRMTGYVKKADQLIVESSAAYVASKTYDIFLSHNIRDAELILGMKGTFEDLGYSVYVDWIEDPQLDRGKVTHATAEKLRQRMNSSKSLFYVTTANTTTSKWMPWECGYFDGKKEKTAIVPIQKTGTGNSYSGQEFLGLYPYIVKQPNTKGVERLWVHKNGPSYIDYDSWVVTPNAQVSWKEG